MRPVWFDSFTLPINEFRSWLLVFDLNSYRKTCCCLGENMNKYLKLKNSWGYCLNSNYLLSSVSSQDKTTCQNNATTYAHTESMTIHRFTQAWAHRHKRPVHTFSFLWNTSSFGVAPNNLTIHAHVILTSHIAFLQFQTTTKNAVTCTHTHTGHRDTVAGDKSRQKRICTSAYSARCLKLEISFRCVLSFAMWNKDS